MARLVVSALSVKPGQIGGAEFMIRNLVGGLASLGDIETTVVTPDDVNGWPSQIAVRAVPVGNRVIAETALLPAIVRNLGADALLLPNYFTPPRLFGVRTATVIHDLLYRRIPGVFRPGKRLWLRCCHRLTVEQASTVIAISRSVADDLIGVYGAKIGRRLVTIPNPIDWERLESSSSNTGHPLGGRPYLLSVAAEWPHKNLHTLISAFARGRCRLRGGALILVGQNRKKLRGRTQSSGRSLQDAIVDSGLEGDVFQTGHIDDAQLGALYRHARAFVFPSLFEGFGMPPVEALGMGLPVITTRCGAIPDSTRQLATYVNDATDADELARAITSVFDAPESFAPSRTQVNELREFYSPVRIARLYRDALFDTPRSAA